MTLRTLLLVRFASNKAVEQHVTAHTPCNIMMMYPTDKLSDTLSESSWFVLGGLTDMLTGKTHLTGFPVTAAAAS